MENLFWDELIEHLALCDVIAELGIEKYQSLEDIERVKKSCTYVGMSRHREGADIYVSREVFKDFADLSRTLSRERAKDVTLDYPQSRGFEVSENFSSHSNPERILSVYDEQTEFINDSACRLAAQLSESVGRNVSFVLGLGYQGHYRRYVTSEDGQRFGVIEFLKKEQLILVSEDRLIDRRMDCLMEFRRESSDNHRLVAVNCDYEKETAVSRQTESFRERDLELETNTTAKNSCDY